MKVLRGTLLFLVILVVGLAGVPAAQADNNFIQIINNCNNKITFYYKCYDKNPWDQNTGCPYDNTQNDVEAGKNWSKTYTYNSIITCKRIYVHYGRWDRSCEANDKSIQAEFPANQPKILIINGDCQGSSFNFQMEPQGGTIIH